MNGKDILWWMGQAASVAIGFAIGATYTASAGFATYYVTTLLVDIRFALENLAPHTPEIKP
jgi:hypothetical protein